MAGGDNGDMVTRNQPNRKCLDSLRLKKLGILANLRR